MNNRNQRGFTLIELMIVVAIIGIIAAIGYPSYNNYIIKAKRSTAKSFLTQVATSQEQYYLDNKSYADDLSLLGYPGDPFFVDKNNHAAAATSSDAIYEIEITASTATSYTLTAKPVNLQLKQDTKCGSLSLTNTGTKTVSGSSKVNECW